MSRDDAVTRARRLERVTPDHLVTCPRCGELLEPWRIACPYCDSHLYLKPWERPRGA